MQRIFDLENPFFSIIRKIMNMICLNLLWILLCVPIVTAGASSAAFYYAIQKTIKHDRGYVFQTFFQGFKVDFKQATLAWLLILAGLTLSLLDIAALDTLVEAGRVTGGFQVLFYLIMILIGVYAVWLFACIARFENTLKDSMRNAAILMIGNLPVSAAVFFLIAGAAMVIWIMPIAALIMPASVLWLASVLTEKVFRKGMSDYDRQTEDERNLEYHND